MSAKNNSESEYYGEILSPDVTLLTCRQKIIVKVNLLEVVNLISLKEIYLNSLDLVQ